MPIMQTLSEAQASPEVPINENFQTVEHQAVYGRRHPATTGLVFGYYGGRWGSADVADGTVSLTASSTNYIVVNRSSGAVSTSTATTNWDNTATYARVYVIVTNGVAIVGDPDDFRVASNGVHASAATVAASVQCLVIACSDETTAVTTGTAKLTFRMPYAFTLTAVRASVTTAPTGSTLIIDINEAGTTILSTKLSIDASEKTSTTAASAAVISDTSLASDAEITIDFDQVGSTIAGTGVKVYLIGSPT